MDYVRLLKSPRARWLSCVTSHVPSANYQEGKHVDEHAGLTALCTMCFCQILGLPAEQSETYIHAAYWHDVGKLALPSSVFNKTTALSPEELRLSRTHPRLGAEQLRRVGLFLCADVALSHHECWDGSGYPNGLAGKAIPMAARIVSICDVYSALRETRPYKPAMTHEDAVRTLVLGDSAGRTRPTMFDPELLSIFESNHKRFAPAKDELPETFLGQPVVPFVLEEPC
jgi:putative two-component system response regulator